MKNTIKKKNNRTDLTIHYYIDESGSPEFYGKRNKLLVGKKGYSPVLGHLEKLLFSNAIV